MVVIRCEGLSLPFDGVPDMIHGGIPKKPGYPSIWGENYAVVWDQHVSFGLDHS